MSDDDEVLAEGDGENMGTIVLMLGLYLIVLAFFILLNAISESSPDRHELVVESVREGFDFREDGDNKGSDDADITAIPMYEASAQEIEGVIQSHLALEDVTIEKKAERVYVTMNIRRFFRPGEDNLIPEMILFFEDLASVLHAPKPGMGVISQILVSGDDSELPGGTEMTELELAGRRASLFVRALIDEGVFKENISAGAVLGEPKVVATFDIFVADYERALSEVKRLQDVLQDVSHEMTVPDAAPAQ